MTQDVSPVPGYARQERTVLKNSQELLSSPKKRLNSFYTRDTIKKDPGSPSNRDGPQDGGNLNNRLERLQQIYLGRKIGDRLLDREEPLVLSRRDLSRPRTATRQPTPDFETVRKTPINQKSKNTILLNRHAATQPTSLLNSMDDPLAALGLRRNSSSHKLKDLKKEILDECDLKAGDRLDQMRTSVSSGLGGTRRVTRIAEEGRMGKRSRVPSTNMRRTIVGNTPGKVVHGRATAGRPAERPGARATNTPISVRRQNMNPFVTNNKYVVADPMVTERHFGAAERNLGAADHRRIRTTANSPNASNDNSRAATPVKKVHNEGVLGARKPGERDIKWVYTREGGLEPADKYRPKRGDNPPSSMRDSYAGARNSRHRTAAGGLAGPQAQPQVKSLAKRIDFKDAVSDRFSSDGYHNDVRSERYSYRGSTRSFLERIVNQEFDGQSDQDYERYLKELKTQVRTARDLKRRLMVQAFRGAVDVPFTNARSEL